MLSLREQIDELRKLGYGADTAQAKVVHDVVLLAMYRSGFKSNSTIKGGVVMSSLTGDVRRATMDMDIDFIRYSLGKPAVARFVRKLARAIPEVELKMVGEPTELKHEDYRGKRIYLAVKVLRCHGGFGRRLILAYIRERRLSKLTSRLKWRMDLSLPSFRPIRLNRYLRRSSSACFVMA